MSCTNTQQQPGLIPGVGAHSHTFRGLLQARPHLLGLSSVKGTPREPASCNHVPTSMVRPEAQGKCSFLSGVAGVGGEEYKENQGPGGGKSLRSGVRQQFPRLFPARPGPSSSCSSGLDVLICEMEKLNSVSSLTCTLR